MILSPRCHDCVTLTNSTQIGLGFSNENNHHHRSMHLLLSSYILTALGSQKLYHPAASIVQQGGSCSLHRGGSASRAYTTSLVPQTTLQPASGRSPYHISSPNKDLHLYILQPPSYSHQHPRYIYLTRLDIPAGWSRWFKP